MGRIGLALFVLFLSLFHITGLAEPAFPMNSRSLAYIEASCRTTRYPALCIRCLSTFVNGTNATLQSPQELAQVALTVSLARAWVTQAYVLEVAHKLSGINSLSLKGCLDQINDSVDQLGQSIRELKRMVRTEGEDFSWHTSNVETWMSTALTDASTCLDEFPGHAVGGKTKAIIKAKVQNVVEVTSNALALFHRFAMRHRASGSTKKP